MPKLEDVVIRMQQNSNNMSKFTQIEWLFPKQIVWEEWLQQRADIPFSSRVIEYLNALSASLLINFPNKANVNIKDALSTGGPSPVISVYSIIRKIPKIVPIL